MNQSISEAIAEAITRKKIYYIEVSGTNYDQNIRERELSLIQFADEYISEASSYTDIQTCKDAMTSIYRLLSKNRERHPYVIWILNLTYKYLELQKRRLL